jgi:hypothetical protein
LAGGTGGAKPCPSFLATPQSRGRCARGAAVRDARPAAGAPARGFVL